MALLVTLAVVLLTRSIQLLSPAAHHPLVVLLFLTTVAVSGWYGGLGPGLVATFLSALAVAFFLIEPDQSRGLDQLDIGLFVVFCLEAGLICWLMAVLHGARDRAQASEERFRIALKHSPITVFSLDRELRFTWVYNPAPPLDPQAVIGKPESDFVSPGDVERLADLKRRVMESGAGMRTVVPLTTAQGEAAVFDLSLEPLRDRAGRVVGVTGAAVDIGARLRADGELRRLAAIVENANDAIIGTAEDGTIFSWNPAAERMFGYSAEEAQGQPVSMLIPPDHATKALELLEGLWRGERVEHFETVRIRKDGTRVDVSVTISPVVDAAGQIVGASHILRDITARKAAEARLAYQAWLLANVNDAIVASDENFRLTAWNAAAEALYGWTAAEVLGKEGLDLVGTEFAGTDKAEVFRVLAETGHYRGEATQARKDGTRIPVEVASTVLRDSTGRITGYASVNRDITERKRAEAALRASETRHRALLNAIPDLLLRIRRDGVFLDVAAAKEVEPLVPPEDFIGKTIAAVMPEAMARQSMDHLRAAFETGATQIFEYPLQIGDEVRHYEARLVVSGEDEALAIVRNISARLRAEAALAAEKERLAVTLRSIGDGVIATDTDGRVTLINPVAERLTGWTQAEAAGRGVEAVLRLVHRVTREPLPNPARQALATGGTVALADHVAVIARTGDERLVADCAAPIRDESGQVLGTVMVLADVTDQRRAEEELAKASKLESIGVLAGGIAHDFNNLLTAILANLSLVKLENYPPEKVAQRLNEAEKASRRAKDLTQRLLTFAEGGNPIRKPARLAGLLREYARLGLLGSSAWAEFDIPDDLWPAEVDEGQIGQVIQNLVLNASQALPQGGPVTVRAENLRLSEAAPPLVAGAYVRITIADHGTGIAPEVLPRIFDPFFTTKPEGHGLGLSVAFSIVRKHGGHIVAESTPGTGTALFVYLPAGRSAAPAEPSRA